MSRSMCRFNRSRAWLMGRTRWRMLGSSPASRWAASSFIWPQSAALRMRVPVTCMRAVVSACHSRCLDPPPSGSASYTATVAGPNTMGLQTGAASVALMAPGLKRPQRITPCQPGNPDGAGHPNAAWCLAAIRTPERGTTYPTWNAARRAQNQDRNVPGRYPPGFVPPNVVKGQVQQQPDWRHKRTQDVPGGGTPSPERGAARRGWTGSAQNPPRQQPAWYQEAPNQRRYQPGQVPPNAASGKAQRAPRGPRPHCPPGKACERNTATQR